MLMEEENESGEKVGVCGRACGFSTQKVDL